MGQLQIAEFDENNKCTHPRSSMNPKNTIKIKKITPRHIIIKSLKTNNKEKNLKSN